ncbi:MAG: PmoA family protein [Lentisphaeria bacterium]|nr:PmoA family protein [Lentisphaeria bacterium]
MKHIARRNPGCILRDAPAVFSRDRQTGAGGDFSGGGTEGLAGRPPCLPRSGSSAAGAGVLPRGVGSGPFPAGGAFLALCAVCLWQPLWAAPQTVAALRQDAAVAVTVDGAPFTTYRFGKDLKKPYLWPVIGPLSGKSVTVESIPDDHPHHNSIWLGCDRVNGQNFWQPHGDVAGGQIRSTGVEIVTAAGPQVHLTDTCIWQKPGAEPVIRDLRQIRIAAPSPNLRLIDFDVTLEMLVDVTVEKTNHSFFSVRMVPELSVKSGGALVNAGGYSAEKGTFGVPSSWCDYVGTREGIVEGVALFEHPGNPWYPSPWFTRDYGFMSPTPMFWPPDGKARRFARGATLPLRYRVVVHGGSTEAAGIPALFAQYAPGVEPEPRPGLPAKLIEDLKQATFGGSRVAISRAEEHIRTAPPELRPVIEGHLLELLRAPDAGADARRFACRKLALLGTDRSLPALMPLLQEPEFAESARFALAQIGTPAALKALRDAFPQAGKELRLAILDSLGAQRDREALPLLREQAAARDTDSARAACDALARLGTVPALDAFDAAARRADLRDAVVHAQLACADRVAAAGNPDRAAKTYTELCGAETPDAVRAAATLGRIRTQPDTAAALALELLRAPTPVPRGAAATAIALLPPGTGVTEALCGAIDGLDAEARVVLAMGLGERGDPAAAPALRGLLGSAAEDVRLAACGALGRVGGPADVRVLAAWLDGEASERDAAVAALVSLAQPGVDQALGEVLASLEQPGGRAAWVRVIQERGGPLPAEQVLTLAVAPDRGLREAALRAVADLGSEAEIAKLINLLEQGLPQGVDSKPFEQALATLCRRFAAAGDAGRFCVEALPRVRPAARASLVSVLGALADESALPILVAAAGDADEGVRDAGVRALAAWPRLSAFEALVETAREATSLAHNVLALRGCRRLLETVRNELGDEEIERRCKAAAAVAQRDEEKKLFDFEAMGVLLKDVKVQSKGTYRVHRGGMADGAKWASDRDYTFRQVPVEVLGATYIEVVMNDRSLGTPDPFVTFQVDAPVVVFVAYDHRCTALPAWLRDWEKTAAVLDSTAVRSHLVLYRKQFPAGPVALGPCAAPGVAAMYSVCVKPAL